MVLTERRFRKGLGILLAVLGFGVLAAVGEAAKIGEVTKSHWHQQALRFWSLSDPAVRYALCGSVFMGMSCGLLGSFLVVRRLSLTGDMLSHAVLPGVALGFLWNMTKDPVTIFIGAATAGLLGTVLVDWIQRTTPIKEDSALGMVLAGFYGLGVCLLTMIQRMPAGNQSGLDTFLFGQAAALSRGDVVLMGIVAVLTVVLLFVLYKEFLVCSFDQGFARVLGIPEGGMHHLLMGLLAFSVVVSLQATGIILVSAMLIIPAASAYLLTDRMHWMLLLAGLFGVTGGAAGAFFSFLGNNLPTGPFMVLGTAGVFALAFCFGPRHGWLARQRRQRRQRCRIAVENTLKAVYHVLEAEDFAHETVALPALAQRRRQSLEEVAREVEALSDQGFATYTPSHGSKRHEAEEKAIALTPSGWLKACQIVRNHRLWELYLTQAAHYAADHVHDDAEVIEHILGETMVRRLERQLNHPSRDPHGKLIPSIKDMESFQSGPTRDEAIIGHNP